MDRVCNLMKQDKFNKAVDTVCIISVIGILITMYNFKYFRYIMDFAAVIFGTGRSNLGTGRSNLDPEEEPKSKFILMFRKKEIIISEVLLFTVTVALILLSYYKCK